MKVIDLLNKIANDGKIPERIKYDTKVMTYDHNKQDYLGYYSNGNGEWLFQYLFDICKSTEHFINDEVEIIEEKKIPKKLKCKYTSQIGKIELAKTINEIIDYLESKGDE